MLDPLLSDRDVEKITGRARSTLQKDRVTGTGIPFVRIGRLVRYRQSDVTAFLDALPRCRSTSEHNLDGGKAQ
jgi:predicted DNA-binding transcriptional regulator AlpA